MSIKMEETALYAKHYNGTDDTYNDNGERYLSVYQGIFQHQSTRENIIYPVLKFLGNVSITQRRFYKGAKYPRKIVRQDGDNVYLFNYHGEDGPITLINTLFTNLGYNNDLLHDIQTVVLNTSANRNIKTNNHNRIGGENDGIVDF